MTNALIFKADLKVTQFIYSIELIYYLLLKQGYQHLCFVVVLQIKDVNILKCLFKRRVLVNILSMSSSWPEGFFYFFFFGYSDRKRELWC